MEVVQVAWWKHNSKSGQYSSAKVHRTLHVEKRKETPMCVDDYAIKIDDLEGLKPEIFEGR
jgi:CRISPR-associated protein Csd2